jgi:hypothetical protein
MVLKISYIRRQFCPRPVWLNASEYSRKPHSLEIAVEFNNKTTATEHMTGKLRPYLPIFSTIAAYNFLTDIAVHNQPQVLIFFMLPSKSRALCISKLFHSRCGSCAHPLLIHSNSAFLK